MNIQEVKRKLTAILSADVKGYSRLMEEDEKGTVRTLNSYKEVMTGLIQHHRGRVVDAPGDNLLAEFASVVDAVECAVEIQKELKTRNAKLPENLRMEFRIGVNLGDVIEDGEQILGDAVNIAARLESLSDAGGICISGSAYDFVGKKLSLGYEYLGEHTVKNIEKAVRVYRVLTEPEQVGKVIGEERLKPKHFPDKPSIAVLPFVNMSKDLDQEYFSDGMTEDLITDLSKISGLLVIARNSTFTYKGKPVKVKQVAEELGVRYVLEGSVRRAGDEIRINAQLVDAMAGHHLWAERYDGTMGKIFALQDQITQKIVSALAVKLTGSEKELVVQKGTDNVAAYDAFLRGWVYYLRLTPDDFMKAVASLKKAIELDPNYGRAYAVLSAVYWDATWSTELLKGLGVSWHEARARSIQYLQKAPKDPITHYVKSRMYVLRRQYQEAISEIERGLALDTNDPACHLEMGLALTMEGRPKDAIEFLKRGMRLDPHNPSRYLVVLGMAHFCMGELEEAAGLLEKAMRLNPETAPSWGCWLAASYGLLGRDQEARTALETTPLKKAWGDHPYNLRIFMYYHPFKDRPVADRYAEGLLKAGVSGKLNDYLPAFKENQLNGEEIKRLLFGSTITGFDWNWPFGIGQQWWMDNKKNGEFTYRAQGEISSDTGKSRIEGDMICWQYQKSFGGVEIRGTVFRYPGGTSKGKEEYFWCSDFGFSTFSLVK
jgi:adenylate cyclase